jgi:uncharacterized lipoprotein YbaY
MRAACGVIMQHPSAMTMLRLAPLPALALLFALAGCKSASPYLNTAPRPMGDQVLRGTVSYPAGVELPADAVLTVRLLDASRNDLPISSQTIARPGASPVAFQIDYKAEDIRPPRRAWVEARVSFGGRLRLRSNALNATGLVTPENASRPVALAVNPIAGAAP